MDWRERFESIRRAEVLNINGAAVPLIVCLCTIASAPLHAQVALPAPTGTPRLTIDAFAMEAIDLGPAVKDAPFSAEATTRFVQTLPDGNRITRRTDASLYRDSRGRTRREVTLENIAGIIAAGEPLRIVTISDPDSGTTYLVDADRQLRVLRNPPGQPRGGPLAPQAGVVPLPPRGGAVQLPPQSGTVGLGSGVPIQPAPGAERQESIGTREIAGVECEGTRTTVTIPAGAIGNERPIESVTERWFSPALRIIVLSRRYDPRFGETTYQLTRITRTEPPATLFEPPKR